MGEDFAGQKRQQDMFQYCMTCSFFSALVSGLLFHSMRMGWYIYLVGLFFTWLINIVDWSYFLAEPTTWAEGKYLDIASCLELEALERVNMSQASSSPKMQRAQITLSGGPARMTISSRPNSPLLSPFTKW